MRILLVQHAGDYREAYRRLHATGEETYYGHRYVLRELERMRASFGEVAMLCCLTPERYHETLSNGLTVIGANAHPRRQAGEVKRIMGEWNPTHLIALGPMTSLIRWGVGSGRRVFCQFADSFNTGPLTRIRQFGLLAPLLNDRRVEWVSNHGVNACGSLARIGVRPDKLLAWDWPHERRPEETPARGAPPAGAALIYVGTLQPSKGVGDVLEAMAVLKTHGHPATLKVVGAGQLDRFQAQAERLGVTDRVKFMGLLPNAEVFALLRASAAVVVPSRHEYPEGLPLTIYEALSARTPIIASDHPMFAGHLRQGETALVFPERRPEALAERVETLLSDRALYLRLSHNALDAWEGLQNPVKWGEVLHRWLQDRPDDRAWLLAHRSAPGVGPARD